MEHQTRFDLSAAIENWQTELAAQPNLTAEVRRELETHLRDTITGFQQCGLNDEESFWLARRRVGHPQQIGEEFVKANPAAVWRERVFWMGVAFLTVDLWGTVVSEFTSSFLYSNLPHNYTSDLGNCLPEWVTFYLPIWLRRIPIMTIVMLLSNFVRVLPVFLLAIALVRGRVKHGKNLWNYTFKSRIRFISIALACFLAVELLNASSYYIFAHPSVSTTSMFLQSFCYRLFWYLPLIGLIGWLIPLSSIKHSKTA
jgi:hypothetical protein